MKNTREILVSTTSSIYWVNVIDYLKPISAHIVAGTDFFSDFFASFSDIFGGRSQTYQKQLSSIYSEAIEALKRSAYEIGANCILGLKVDMDEISGKNKSMFMITAIGTAAIIDYPTKVKSKENNLDVISVDLMNDLRRREKLINLAKSGKLYLDDSIWDFVTNNCVNEIAIDILDLIKKDFQYYDSDKRLKIFKRLSLYFYSLDEDLRTSILYNYYINDASGIFTTYLYDLLKDLTIFRVDNLLEYLSSSDIQVQKKALVLVVIDKPYFNLEDVTGYSQLKEVIKKSFKKNGELILVKSKLTNKEKEVWKCDCGKSNNVDAIRCDCGLDRMGFFESEVSTDKAIKIIDDNINMIQKILSKK